MSAALKDPNAEVWLLYGDGSAGYSIVEFDTFVRHKVRHTHPILYTQYLHKHTPSVETVDSYNCCGGE